VNIHSKPVDTSSPLKPLVVRVAGPADEKEVSRLLMLGHAENGMFPFDPAKVYWFMTVFLNAHKMPAHWTGPRGVIAVIGPKAGHLEAIAMVGISEFWYTRHRHLEEFIVYVDPEHRKPNRGHASALCDWLQDQSEKLRLPLTTGILSNHRTEAKCRLYDRKFTRVGAYYTHVPKGVEWECDHMLNEIFGSSLAA
jgi:hypothetical protein